MRTRAIQTRQTEPSVSDMRYDLAEQEAMNMGTEEIIQLLIHGYEGLELLPDGEIIDEWKEMFENES